MTCVLPPPAFIRHVPRSFGLPLAPDFVSASGQLKVGSKATSHWFHSLLQYSMFVSVPTLALQNVLNNKGAVSSGRGELFQGNGIL